MVNVLPAPRVQDPLEAPPLNWGILGTGWIAEHFTAALQTRTRQRVVAVGSRDLARATRFAAQFGIDRAHANYEAVAEDPAVDIVYVATPHNFHHRDALLALRAGKHVLVEKPFTVDAAQAREIAEVANAAGLFCMEALWTLFLPRYDVVRQVVEGGMLGEVTSAIIDHGQWFPPGHRNHRRDLAGGSLLDLASYTVAIADAFLGPVAHVDAAAQLTPAGVEGQVSAVATHATGSQSMHHSSILCDTPARAVIAGTDGLLVMDGFHSPGRVTVSFRDRRPDLVHEELLTGHHDLFWQACEVARAIRSGATESHIRPVAASVRCMDVLDRMRAAAGVPPLDDRIGVGLVSPSP